MIIVEIIKEIKNNWKYLVLSIVIALLYISIFNAQAAGAADLNVSLSYREMIALGPEAEARLILVDPAESEQKLVLKDLEKDLKNGVPVNFSLDLDSVEIKAEKNYQLLGIIKAGQDMIWTAKKEYQGSRLLKAKKINLLSRRTPARLINFYGDKNLKVRFLDGLAQLIFDSKEYILVQQKTASGAKFVNSELSIWNKGRQILLEQGKEEYQAELISISDLNQSSKLHARGQEPYWELNLTENYLELKYDYLANTIRIPMANVKRVAKAEAVVYQVESSFLDFELKFLEDIHYDQMNGRLYPLTAFVKIKGEKFIGGADLLK